MPKVARPSMWLSIFQQSKRQPLQPFQLFDCIRYPEWLWKLMRWNRSSYVNRLRKSEWKRLFHEAGLVLRVEESRVSRQIENTLPTLQYLHKYSRDDAVTNALTVWLESRPRQPRDTSSSPLPPKPMRHAWHTWP